MWLKNFSIAAGAALLGVASAHATIDRGWYVGLEAGWNGLQDVGAVAVPDGGPTFTGDVELDGGWAALMTGGYAFTPNWRVELELGFRSNDVDALCPDGDVCGLTAGSVEQFTQMLNVIYDWRIADRWSIATGLGVGGDYVEVDSVFGSDNDYVFAYQALAGLNYHLSDRMDVVLNYRYLRSEGPEFQTTDLGGTDWAIEMDELENHTVTVGLRWDLHPASAPPVVIQPQVREPAKQYIVFFGFNKSNLTSEAQAVVAEAATAAKQMGTATILVTGHTDTVGGNAYNNRLSQRRADVVRSELERLGVSSKIITSAKGETELLVQTADNAKEPQNRRTTIDLQ